MPEASGSLFLLRWMREVHDRFPRAMREVWSRMLRPKIRSLRDVLLNTILHALVRYRRSHASDGQDRLTHRVLQGLILILPVSQLPRLLSLTAHRFGFETAVRTGRSAWDVLRSRRPAAATRTQRLASRRFRPSPSETAASISTPTFSRKVMAEALRDALDRLESASIRPFLAFGTLLGMMREGGFMDDDSDIDLGVMYAETDCATVHGVLESAGYEIIRCNPDPWPCRVQARLSADHPLIDIVFFRRQDHHLQTCTMVMSHPLIRDRITFDLERARFEGMEVWIPDRAETFLEQNYGDWRVRTDFHHWILTSPLTDFRDPAVEFTLLQTLIRSAVDGAAAAETHLKRIGRTRYPADPFWQAMA